MGFIATFYLKKLDGPIFQTRGQFFENIGPGERVGLIFLNFGRPKFF